jgi:hypothetical protein
MPKTHLLYSNLCNARHRSKMATLKATPSLVQFTRNVHSQTNQMVMMLPQGKVFTNHAFLMSQQSLLFDVFVCFVSLDEPQLPMTGPGRGGKSTLLFSEKPSYQRAWRPRILNSMAQIV